MRICKPIILNDNVQIMEKDGGRRKTEMEKEENIWRRKNIWSVEEKNTKGKEGKYHGEGKNVA